MAHIETSEVIETSPFRTALAEWKRAHADVSACEAAMTEENGDEVDKAECEALKALSAAEWKLLRTPAGGIVDIRERAIVVQDLFNRARWMGAPTDNVHKYMLDALVYEILSPIAED
jgi:hypothetical protein